MPDLFRAYQVRDAKIPTYLIESSAPINIDDSSSPPALPDRLTPLDAQEAIHQIAGHLRTVEEPNLVVMVHGGQMWRHLPVHAAIGAVRPASGSSGKAHHPCA
jgi:hypothetical protein